HLLDNLTPSDARIVCAEGNFTLLRAVRDDAHLGAPKVVIEQVLKPHSRDKQEIPAVLAPLEDLPDAIGVALPQVYAAHDPASATAELLIELLDQVDESKILWRLEWVVVANEREREADDRQDQAATGVIHLRHVLGEPLCPEEGRHGRRLPGLFVDHHRHPDAAVRMAPASELSPLGIGPVDE